jgi:hypothetical protein
MESVSLFLLWHLAKSVSPERDERAAVYALQYVHSFCTDSETDLSNQFTGEREEGVLFIKLS